VFKGLDSRASRRGARVASSGNPEIKKKKNQSKAKKKKNVSRELFFKKKKKKSRQSSRRWPFLTCHHACPGP
jgi:hypothetical protein